MKIWILKAVIQKAISLLPASQSVNYLFQKYVTKGVHLTQDYFEDKLMHSNNHANAFLKHKESLHNISSLELGTGWYPIVPICMYLMGAGKIYSVDLNSLAKHNNILLLLNWIVKYHKSGKLKELLPLYKEERYKELESYLEKAAPLSKTELLKLFNIELIIGDARNLPFQDDTFDLITSNNTFEHVYTPILKSILREFKRIVKTKGIMSHFIDMSDHFAHMDTSINIYNFLQFSDHQWKIIDNSVQPQNRLRIPHYREIYKKLDISINEEVNRPGNITQLESIKLSPEFEPIVKEELAISHSLVISQM